MRTTLKAQAIRLIAIFLLICASTTTVKAQISQHPELYKVKEFHNMDKDGGAYYCFTDAQYYQGKLYGVYIDNNGPSSIRLIAFEVNGETRTMEQSTVGDTGKKMIFLNDFGVYQDAEIIVYRNRFYVLWKNNTNGQIWIGEVDMKKGEYKKTRMLDDGKTYANFAATIYRDKICVILHRRTNKKLQVYQYGDPELNSGWDWSGHRHRPGRRRRYICPGFGREVRDGVVERACRAAPDRRRRRTCGAQSACRRPTSASGSPRQSRTP